MEIPLIIVIGLLLGLVVFIRPTIGLAIILFSTLFFPEVEFGAVTTLTGMSQRGISLRPEDFLIILAGLGWFANAAIRRQLPSLTQNPLNIPIIVFTLVIIFSTVIGIMQGTTTAGAGFFYALKRIQYFIVFILVIGNIKSFQGVKNSVLLFFIFSAVIAVWSIIEYFSLEFGRITGPFMRTGQPPILGGYFLMVIFLGLGLLFKSQNRRSRLPLLAIIVLSFIVIIFTKTRSSYVGAFIGMIIFGIVYKKPSLIVIPFILVIIMYYVFPTTIVEQMVSVKGVWQRGGPRSFAPSWDARVSAWESSLPKMAEYPILGQGPGSYSLAWMDNQYVIDMLYMGIIGLGAFIWLLFTIFRNTYPLTRPVETTDGKATDYNFINALAAGYLGGLIALLVHAVAVTTFWNIRTMVPFWFLTGLVMVARNYYQDKIENIKPVL